MTRRWGVPLSAAVLTLLCGQAAHAAHNIVTDSVSVSTPNAIAGSVEVKNTVAPGQTGKLTLLVLEATNHGIKERARQSLGTVDLAPGAGSTTNVPFTIDTRSGKFDKGVFVILADYDSSLKTPGGLVKVAHTHCGTVTVMRDVHGRDDASGGNP
jgi:hypothetical protein